MNVHEFMEKASNNYNITNAIAKTWDVLGRFQHPACSISGGSDSDIMLDIVHKLDDEHKVRYIFCETGIEYQATRRHLDFLQDKYSIKIERIKPVMTVPECARKIGQPFLSKHVSSFIEGLQNLGFDWANIPYEQHAAMFPHHTSYLKWWHNKYSKIHAIRYNKLLKEFLIAHHPEFNISAKCCTFAKKKPAEMFYRDNYIDLVLLGLRQAEGGIRSLSINNCFSQSEDFAILRPIFWFSDNDKLEYEKLFGVTHSDCYTVYGLKRTGCVGCPFNRNVFNELDTVRQYEPALVRNIERVFADSLAYTKQYKAFRYFGSDTPLFTEDLGEEKNEDNQESN